MFKRIFSGILLAALLFALAAPALANDPSTMPLECKMFASISFENGSAKAVAASLSAPGYTLTSSVTLQRKVGHKWINVASASGSLEACASVTAAKGMYYRAVGTCKYYRNNQYIGSLSATSASKSY